MKDICNFTILDETGKEFNCEVLFSFKSDENDKTYLVYTDGTKDENDELNILASRFTIKSGQLELEDITDDNEWDIVDKYIKENI